MTPLRSRSSALGVRRPLAWNGPLITLIGLGLSILAGMLLTQLSPQESIALVGLLAVAIGALIEPLVGLGAALFLGPLKAYLSAEVPQIPAQVGHIFVALALGSWLMRRLSEREIRISDLGSPLTLTLLGFLGTVLLSLWDAVGLAAYGIPELIKWGEILLLFVFVKEHLARKTHSPRTKRRLRWLVTVLLAVGAFQALVGIWQFGLRGEGPEHFRILGGDFFRAYGTFEQPNPYAGYLGLTAALAVGIVVGAVWDRLTGRGGSLGGRRGIGSGRELGVEGVPERLIEEVANVPLYLLGVGASIVMMVALIASWSRGAWMGFGAAALVIAAALPRKTAGSALLVTVLVVGGVGLYASGRLPTSFTARLTSFVQDIRLEDVRGVPINDANYAVIERLAHWQAALSMVRYNLWTGVGFGCYEPAYPTFALINWPIALGHAHNIYLNLAAETGLLGLVAYVSLWAVVLWQTWRATRQARGLMRGLAVGLLGVWTHLSVHHVLDNLYVNNVHLHIGVMLGLAAFIIQRTGQRTSVYV